LIAENVQKLINKAIFEIFNSPISLENQDKYGNCKMWENKPYSVKNK
jgi:hypothetical protein